jgi:hypothetical protein
MQEITISLDDESIKILNTLPPHFDLSAYIRFIIHEFKDEKEYAKLLKWLYPSKTFSKKLKFTT